MEFLEFQKRRETLGGELIGRLYFLPARKKLILAPVYLNSASLSYEQERVEVVPIEGAISCEELGRQAHETLLRCERKDKNLRTRKDSDWAAYHASGATSLRQFRKIAYLVELTTCPVVIEVTAWPPQADEEAVGELGMHLRAYAGLPGEDKDLGTLILRMVRCCQTLHAEGLA